MLRKSIFLFLMVLMGCGIKQTARFQQTLLMDRFESKPELRGAWVTRYSWADTKPDTMKLRIQQVMKTLGDANFNAVFFQVRGQADPLYPSPHEPWSRLVGYSDPEFDPVELAIKEARQNGLTFYAYINLLPLWDLDKPPSDSTHLYFRHGPEVCSESSWVCFDTTGRPMQRNSYYYLNPVLPKVRTYLKKIIRHFVETYDIDGLHFDRIRYPGPDYVNDPYSLEKFRTDSLRSPCSKDEWVRRQLTDLVEDVVVEAMLVKPYLVNSAATWGLYRTDDFSIPGYEDFSSGFAGYYQDAVDWLDRGIMDFIVPMMYYDITDPVPNFDDIWLDFKNRTPNFRFIYPGIRLRKKWVASGETARQINFVRQNGGEGTVLFSIAPGDDHMTSMIGDMLYTSKVPLPKGIKRTRAGQVIGLNVTNLLDTVKSGQAISIMGGKRTKATDSEGRLGYILTEKPDTLSVSVDQLSVMLPTWKWKPPYNYSVQPDHTVARETPWIEFRRTPDDTTYRPEFDLLCKTVYPARAFINGDSVKVYKTGIFFDTIQLEEGRNRVTAKIIDQDSATALYAQEYVYKKVDRTRNPFPLWIEEQSLEPRYDMMVLPEDFIRIQFSGSKGQKGFVELQPGRIRLVCSREDFPDYSLYKADLPASNLEIDKQYRIRLVLETEEEGIEEKRFTFNNESLIEVKQPEEFPLVKTIREDAALTYDLGRIRLGGPIRTEFGPGVVLNTSGKFGEFYRIRLNSVEQGYIRERDVERLPQTEVQPGYFIRSLFCAPEDSLADLLSIPYPEPVPYTVVPQPDLKRILIRLYGVKTSSTWITHRAGLRYIEKVTWEQTTPETYEIAVNLKTSKIWGYELKRDEGRLAFRIKYPPEMNTEAEKPLTGLKIAIEAGHGGDNLGAIGLSGLEEKEINLDLSRKLAQVCQLNGAEILQVRDRDRAMSLTAKRDTVRYSDADLFISIHANAAGGGYLRVGGTSTYYHNPFWAPLAERIYSRLLELDLAEFGVIGSFNYRVIRITQMPSILVEQAFMTHAEDEEKLASESFRMMMAEKIYQGIIDYIKDMGIKNK